MKRTVIATALLGLLSPMTALAQEGAATIGTRLMQDTAVTSALVRVTRDEGPGGPALAGGQCHQGTRNRGRLPRPRRRDRRRQAVERGEHPDARHDHLRRARR